MRLPTALLAAAFFATAVLTGIARFWAIRTGLLDVPNMRSSHEQATPRGGGIGIVVVVIATALTFALRTEVAPLTALAWCAGGALVAAFGFVDDQRHLSARVRILAHVIAAVLAVWATGGLPPLPAQTGALSLGILGTGMAVVGTIWSINLFNFMDGTDGIAAAQAVFVAGAGGALAVASDSLTPNVGMALVVAAASLGFLVWNWPPAKIFMGDVGSGFLGLALAICALQTSLEGTVNLWTWIVLHGLFVSDSTVTLLVRIGRRERIYEAHRQHTYQRLSRRWKSHRKVLLLFTGINLFWLLPIAILTVRNPGYGLSLTLIGLAPLCIAALVAGAGRND
jgi:Fuc2NAc and GlcNAc transferase